MSNRQQRRLQQKRLRKRGSARAQPVVNAGNKVQALQTAVQHHQNGRYREAAAIYRQVLEIDPDNVDALNGAGMIEYQAKRYDRALKLLGRVIDAVPDNPGYYMNLGAVQEAAGYDAEAEVSYRKAIELEPHYADPYYNLGDLYLRQGNPERAIEVFDACMDAKGREYHALAYKAHALIDAGRMDEANWLLDFDTYVKAYTFDPPEGFDTIDAFNAELGRHVRTHPTLQGGVMSTENGEHTGELLREPKGPMGPMEARINEAIRWYIDQLPDDPEHPAVKWVPERWKLTSWGVVMFNRGHERAHIHPNGWLSGVFYLRLPDVIDDPARNPEGWLEFGRPTGDLHVHAAPELRHYKPAYGQMFLFPSYMYHGTVPFKSDQRRICVAFDVEPA